MVVFLCLIDRDKEDGRHQIGIEKITVPVIYDSEMSNFL